MQEVAGANPVVRSIVRVSPRGEAPRCQRGLGRFNSGHPLHHVDVWAMEARRKNGADAERRLNDRVRVISCFVAFPRKVESRVADAPIAVPEPRGSGAGTSKGSAFPESDTRSCGFESRRLHHFTLLWPSGKAPPW